MKRIYIIILYALTTMSLSAEQAEVLELRRRISTNPDDLQAYFSLGNLMIKQEDLPAAQSYYQEILNRFQGDPGVWHNMAYTVRWQGNLEYAIYCYQQELGFDPNNQNAHFGLAQAYLLGGNFAQGLPEFQLGRQASAHASLKKPFDLNDIKGTTIIIQAEWGFGDMLQFVRYAQLLHDRGARIIVHTPDALEPLLRLCPYLHDVVPFSSQSAVSGHFVIPLLSLMYQFDTTLDTIPVNIPYLYADSRLTELWRTKLEHDHNLRIGICWQGSTINSYPNKNVPLELLYDLARIPGVSLYSLQKLAGSEQLSTLPADVIIHDFGPEFDTIHGRFMDTAAVMQHLDLVLTIDTSLAHLAAGLGIPTWVMLPYVGDWRWLLHREDSPWYPSMRLFRQQKAGNWVEVTRAIEAEVKKLIRKRA